MNVGDIDQRNAEIRAELSRGIEEELQQLAHASISRRAWELAFFLSLAALGTLTIMVATESVQPGWRWSTQIIGTMMVAVALNAFVLLLHEGMHGVLLPGSMANRWLSVLLGATTAIGFTSYQVMHQRHHRYLGHPEDPDEYQNYSGRPRVLLLMHLLRLAVGSLFYLFLIPVLSFRYGTPVERRRIVSEYLVLVVLYITLFCLVPLAVLLQVWLIPVVITGWMVNIRGFTQHSLSDVTDPFLASRNVRTNRCVEFLMLNENYHLEHHLFPEIPSHHLPRLHCLLESRLPRVNEVSGYLPFVVGFARQAIGRHGSRGTR